MTPYECAVSLRFLRRALPSARGKDLILYGGFIFILFVARGGDTTTVALWVILFAAQEMLASARGDHLFKCAPVKPTRGFAVNPSAIDGLALGLDETLLTPIGRLPHRTRAQDCVRRMTRL